MTGCPSDETVALFLQGELEVEQSTEVRRHLDECAACRAVLADVVRAEGHLDLDPTSVVVGDVLGNKYRIEELLGTGGMGAVFSARHVELDLPVAIKVMHPSLVHDADAVRRISREARATAALTSPNIVRVLDIDRAPNGAPYIVMELLEGSDLASILAKSGALPIDQVLDVGLQVCAALVEAHARGIVHRDLKPNNLLVTRDGTVKVVDFGLVKRLPFADHDGASGSAATKTSTLVGSPQYMAPEQIRSPKDVDARADVWGLGATLYHLVAGTVPFFGATLYTLCARILAEPAPPLAEQRPDVPPALAAIIAKCLAKAPADRYASIAELATALREVDEVAGAGASSGDTVIDQAIPATLMEEESTPRVDSRLPRHQSFALVLRRDALSSAPTQWMLRRLSRLSVGRADAEPVVDQRDGVLDVWLDDPHLSSQHFALERREEGWLLEDLGSTNGTMVNGEARKVAMLADRDVIEAGRTFFVFRAFDGPTALESIVSLSGEKDDLLESLSPATQALYRALAQLAKGRLPLVLEGDPGTGKEFLARGLHQLAGRAGAFVTVDASAAPDLPQRIRAAHRGTLFVREIGDLPPAAQDAILEASHDRRTEVRLVLSTTAPVRDLVRQGRIRDDLQARAASSTARVLPLRDRIEDLGVILRLLLRRAGMSEGVTLSASAARALLRYSWPGNVRELATAFEAALTHSHGGRLDVNDFPPAIRAFSASVSL